MNNYYIAVLIVVYKYSLLIDNCPKPSTTFNFQFVFVVGHIIFKGRAAFPDLIQFDNIVWVSFAALD